jgi:hypothetical protein
MGGKRKNKEWDLNWDHLFSRVSEYKRRSDVKEVAIMKFIVYFECQVVYPLPSYLGLHRVDFGQRVEYSNHH